MNSKIILILILFTFSTFKIYGQLTFSGTSGNFITDSKLPNVEVLHPNGGEAFNYLEPITINWIATDESMTSNSIYIGMSTEIGGMFSIIATNLPNNGSAEISTSGIMTDYALIKVIAVDDYGLSGDDESNDYFIVDDSFSGTSVNFISDSKIPDVEVLSPNGGETFNYLDSLKVTWAATDTSFSTYPISIALSTQVSGVYTIVATGLPNTGSAMVMPPGIFTEDAKVKVIGADDFGIEGEDVTNGYFTFDDSFAGLSANFITDSKPPEINVISPNGGESIYFADSLLVKWNSYDDSYGADPVSISISTDGGITFSEIAANLPNQDSVFVMPPQVISDLSLLKVNVQDMFGLSAFDESDDFLSLHGLSIDLRVYLEGPFGGSSMLTFLNFLGYLPTAQPYNSDPWYYNGLELVDSIPIQNIVDWILVELRDAPDIASADESSIVGIRAAFLLDNGTITEIDGTSPLEFVVDPMDNLFAVIYHRNHMTVMSATPLTGTDYHFSFDFTVDESTVFGGILVHRELVPGKWGMLGGDGNADGNINNIDKNDIWLPQKYNTGYYIGDFDMNGTVLNNDKEILWEENVGKSRILP